MKLSGPLKRQKVIQYRITNLVIMENAICCWIFSWNGIAPKLLHKEHLVTDGGRRIHLEIWQDNIGINLRYLPIFPKARE
jgi:hypothetical protein